MLKYLNDVTTDFKNPPRFVSLLQIEPDRDYSYKPECEELQLKLHPDIRPLDVYKESFFVFQVAEDVADRLGWDIHSQDKANLRIECTDTTLIFRFKDDICIEVREINDEHCQVHIRSKSRVGKSDLGKNASRIKDFFEALESRVRT